MVRIPHGTPRHTFVGGAVTLPKLLSETGQGCPPPPLLAHIRDEGSLGSGKFKVRVEKVVARFAFDSGESVDRTATVGYLTEVLF